MSYAWLTRAAGNVLQRNIPKNVNWGAIPTQFMNTLDDIYRMVPGASREAARNQAQRTLRRSVAPRPTRPAIGTAGPSGQFRAPVIGSPGAPRPPSVSIPPQSPVGRGPYAIDYGLRRQAMGDVRNANLVRGAANQGLNPVLNSIIDVTGLGYAIPRAAEAGIGLFEAAEGVVRGQNPRQIIDRMNQPGYQGVSPQGVPTGTFTSARGEGYGTPPGTKKGSLRDFGPGYKEKELRAGGSLRNYGPGYKEEELKAGRQAEQFRAGAGFPGQQLTGGAQPPGAGLGNDAVVSTYDMTPQGQFQRYFTDNQMGRYFGGAPSAQAPKSAEAMQEAAMLQKAPTTMPLADYYRSQSATGRANMDQIVGLMGYTGDMEKWARANPMLAQRAFAQQFQGGGPATLGNPDAVPVPDAALNPAGPEFSGVGGNGERIYKTFQDLLNKKSAQ